MDQGRWPLKITDLALARHINTVRDGMRRGSALTHRMKLVAEACARNKLQRSQY